MSNNVGSGTNSALSALMAMMTKEETSGMLEHNVADTQEKIVASLKDSQVMKGGYGNSLLSIGTDDKSATFNTLGMSNDSLNFPLWLALYNDSWVFKRAIDKPSQDCIRAGLTLDNTFDKKDDVLRMLKKYRFDLIQLLQWGALFGGSIAVCMFDTFDDESYARPIKENLKELDKAKAMKMYVVDRWYGVAPTYGDIVDDMNSLDYSKPKFYDVTFADGVSIKVHCDYVLRYEHRTAPKLIKNGLLQGWGYSEGSHILGELMRDDKLKNSIQSLIDKALIEVIKMAGMRGIFLGADQENEDQLRKRLEMVNWGRNFNSLTFLDKDDEYTMNSFGGLSGLSDMLEKNMWQISAALEMQGVLYGDLKQGFSNDADALERYDDTILNRNDSYVRPIHEKLLWIIYKWFGIDERIEFSYNSLLVKKQDEERIESLQKFTELCGKLLDAGVIDTKQFAIAFRNYTVKSEVDFGLTDEYIKELETKMLEESEDFEELDVEE